MSGLFITLEGGEGAGKTTVAYSVIEKLSSVGIKAIYTREPGGIKIAEKIREIILDPNHTEMDCRTEALLYAAARRQHLVEKVKPAMENGYVVLCDRFVDSSIVYQGYARGIGMEEVLKMNEFAIEGFMPNLTIFFDIEPEEEQLLVVTTTNGCGTDSPRIVSANRIPFPSSNSKSKITTLMTRLFSRERASFSLPVSPHNTMFSCSWSAVRNSSRFS